MFSSVVLNFLSIHALCKITVGSVSFWQRAFSTSNHVLTFIRPGVDDEIRCSVTGNAASSLLRDHRQGKGVDHVIRVGGKRQVGNSI